MFTMLLPMHFMWAQSVTVSGTILDNTNEPIPGVAVVEKGTTTGTITDVGGNYSITVSPDATLIISYVGFATQEITVGSRSVIDVSLQEDIQQLDELVVTGYSIERKKDQLGAVAVADMGKVKDLNSPNVIAQMQGRIPGVFVNTSGNPGQGAKITIRGRSTLGNNSPLYIVDGVPIQPYTGSGTSTTIPNWDLGWLNPNDIESMQVLKDGASASIYGSRASNGVVIITTKSPQKGKSSVTVSAKFGFEDVTAVQDLATSEEKAIIQWQAAVNDGANPDAGGRYTYDWHLDQSLGAGIQGTGVPVLDKINYPDWLDQGQGLRPAGHPSSFWTGTKWGGKSLERGMDWNDAVYRSGFSRNYDIGLNRAGENGGVTLGLNYFDQKGVVMRTGYNRINIRLNSYYKFAGDKVTVGQNLGLSKEERLWSDNGFGGTPDNLMLNMKPILPVRHEPTDTSNPIETSRISGPPGQGFDDRDNPVGLADDNKNDRIHNTKVVASVYLNWEIMEGLSFKTTLGVDYDNIFSRDIFPTFNRGFLNNATAELTHAQLHQTNWVFNNTLTYNKTIDRHSITVLAGTEAIENFITQFSARGKGFALETNDYVQLDAASGERSSTGFSTGFSLFSLFGKANYSFNNRYLASFTIRRDGSSRFGTENQYALFPAASVGWRIVEEEFMSGLTLLSDLKVRAALGKTGNQDILNEARFGLYEAVYAPPSTYLPWGGGCAQTICDNAATSYDIDDNNSGQLPSGFLAIQTENNKLKWESTTEINVGLDFGLMDDRITGSVDAFKKKTTDILIRPSVVGTYGDGFRRWANGADMETTGWEFLIGYNSLSVGDLSYSVSINGAHYNDKITDLPEDLWASYPGNVEQNIIGHSPNAFFGYVMEGILQSPEEAASAPQYPGIRVGSFRYADLNNDNVIDGLDRKYQGTNGLAKLEYGINGQVGWKDFDLTMQFFGMTGRKLSNGDYEELGGLAPGRNSGSASLNAWSYTNTDTWIPALSTSTRPLGFGSYYIRNGGFLNLRQITLGYTLPQAVIGSVSWLSNLRVFVSMENLKYWYTRSGRNGFRSAAWLIEGNQFNTRIPKPLRATFGINIGF